MPKLVKKVKVDAWEYNAVTFTSRASAIAVALSDAVTTWRESRTTEQTTQISGIGYDVRRATTIDTAQAIIDLGLALKAVLDSVDDN